MPEQSLSLTSSACHSAGEEVGLSPLVADGLVKEELDRAILGCSVPGLDRQNCVNASAHTMSSCFPRLHDKVNTLPMHY